MAKRKAAAVSMDPAFELLAKARAKALGFSTFSAYVNQLIRADLMSGGALIISASGGGMAAGRDIKNNDPLPTPKLSAKKNPNKIKP